MKYGFTLIEMMLVLLIIGIITSIGLPRFMRGRTTQGEEFITRLNALVQYGAQIALQTQKVKTIFFNMTGKKVELRTNDTVEKSIEIPNGIEITDFFVNGVNQFSAGGGERLTAYFYINSEGITQEIKLIFIDRALQQRRPQAGNYEIQLNPFTALFSIQ